MWQAMAMAASDTRAGWHPNAIAINSCVPAEDSFSKRHCIANFAW